MRNLAKEAAYRLHGGLHPSIGAAKSCRSLSLARFVEKTNEHTDDMGKHRDIISERSAGFSHPSRLAAELKMNGSRAASAEGCERCSKRQRIQWSRALSIATTGSPKALSRFNQL